MKKLICLLLLFAAVAAVTAPLAPTGKVKLEWSTPTNDLNLATDTGFKIYHSTNVLTPLTNWAVLTNLSATAAFGTNGPGTNFYVFTTIVPGPHFFAATMTNAWGETDFSNVAWMPALPSSDLNLRVKRGD